MAKSGGVARHLRTLIKVGAVGSLPDGQLLERFVARHGEAEAAFAALVERHGPMVLGVCRRALADPRDAEDAFQATFLILVKKAGTVRVDDSLGRWLYGVACRVTARARAEVIRRHAKEGEGLVDRAGPSFDSDRLDLRGVLDEELDRLPEKYRAPVVLCYLEGLTHETAAERLGWPVGTVRGRLSRARERLRIRLSSRGLAPTAAGLWDFPMQTPTGAVSHALIEETARAAIQYATTRVAVGGISTAVAVLTEGALKTMVLSKLKTSAVLLFAMATTSMVAPAFLAASGPPKAASQEQQPAAALEQIKSEPQPTPKQIEAVELATKAFGPTHWSADKALPVRYYNHERGYWMYAKEHERLNDGKQLRLKPFAVVLKSRNDQALMSASSDEAIVDLDQPFGMGNQSGTAMKITHVRLVGDVRFNAGQGTPDSTDDLAIGPLSAAELDVASLSIRSKSFVTIEEHDMQIAGTGLSIQFHPNDEDHRVKSLEIKKHANLKIKNLIHPKAGPSQPKAVNGQEEPESLELRCAGMMLIAWRRPERDVKTGPRASSELTLVSLSGNVVAIRRDDKGQEPDRLECDHLNLNLKPVVSLGTGAGLSVHQLRATGDAVWLRSPSQRIMAHCTEVTFRRLPPDQGDETCLRGEGETKVWVQKEETAAEGLGKGLRRWVTTIMATDVTILEDGQDRENRTIVARGPGRLATHPAEDRPFRAIEAPGPDLFESSPARNKPVERKATWQDQLIMRTVFDSHDRPTQKVTLTGRPTFFGPESETLSADTSLVITLKPKVD